MTDRVSLSAKHDNVEDCIQLASERGLGIEFMVFAYPEVLDGNWRALVKKYQPMLQDVPGPITSHGPFLDLAAGSPDKKVNQLCMDRYRQGLDVAATLGSQHLVFHANIIATLRNGFYLEGWQERNIEFWSRYIEYARPYNITIAIENMWEFTPSIIGNLVKAINDPHFRVCLDVGHAHLFSDDDVSFDDWLQELGPYIVELHVNNNNGCIDEHHGFDWEQGVLNYHELLPQIRTATHSPCIVLEMDEVQDMRDSLPYFDLT